MSNTKFSFSFNATSYTGDYETREAAITAARQDAQSALPEFRFTRFWTGKNRPVELELYCLDADVVLESLADNEDDLQIEQAENWPLATSEQKADLTSSLKSCFHVWLQRHKLQPDFWVVDDVQMHDVAELN